VVDQQHLGVAGHHEVRNQVLGRRGRFGSAAQFGTGLDPRGGIGEVFAFEGVERSDGGEFGADRTDT